MPIVVIKTINRCNSNCIYCFSEKNKQLNKISLATIKALFFKLYEYLENIDDGIIEVQWHGGEPLLLGEEFYQKVAGLQNTILGKYQERIVHTMQSNLTLLNEKMLNVFILLKIKSLGTSVDPIAGIRGFGKTVDSKTYLMKFLQGISLIESMNINWGINYVVTKSSYKIPEDILHYLTNFSLSKHIVFNPLKVTTPSARPFEITPRQFTHFLERIYSLRTKENNLINGIEPIHSMKLAADQIYHNISINETLQEVPIVVDGKGNFYNYKFPENPIGSLYLDNFNDLINKNRLINSSIIDREKQKRGCLKCLLWPVCKANTINDSFSQNEEYTNMEWCRARKRFVFDFLLIQKKIENG